MPDSLYYFLAALVTLVMYRFWRKGKIKEYKSEKLNLYFDQKIKIGLIVATVTFFLIAFIKFLDFIFDIK